MGELDFDLVLIDVLVQDSEGSLVNVLIRRVVAARLQFRQEHERTVRACLPLDKKFLDACFIFAQPANRDATSIAACVEATFFDNSCQRSEEKTQA